MGVRHHSLPASLPAIAVAVIGLSVGAAVFIEPAGAQSSFAPSVQPDRWQELTPDDRHQMRRQYLESLPPGKRAKLRSQVKRFNSMSPTKKQDLCRRFQKDRGYLPPACQKLF